MADSTLRREKLTALTHDETDDNFVYLRDKVDEGLVNGNTLKWDDANGKWEQNSLLFVDTTNSRVGIGVGTSPSTALDVNGDIQCSGKIDGGTY